MQNIKNNNIVLIGFMGCGKGTIARKLSKASGIFAVDTDDLIESLANKTIKETKIIETTKVTKINKTKT